MVAVPINHISLDERGVAYITGTSMKVAGIVIDTVTWGMSVPEIQANYPKLTPAQIYAALSYYHDHKAEIDSLLEQWDAEYEAIRAQDTNPLTRETLEARLRRQ